MGAENFAKVMQQGKRSAARARVLLTAKLRTPFGNIEARLRDLSRNGALLECNDSLALDCEVVFSRGDTTVPARVAWVSGKRVGLEFLRPIDESEVLIQRTRAAAASVPAAPPTPFKRPGLRGQGLTEQERKLAEAWGVSVGISVPN